MTNNFNNIFDNTTEALLNALYRNIKNANDMINAFEYIGFIVESNTSKKNSVPDMIYNIITDSTNAILKIFDIHRDSLIAEEVTRRIDDYIEKLPDIEVFPNELRNEIQELKLLHHI